MFSQILYRFFSLISKQENVNDVDKKTMFLMGEGFWRETALKIRKKDFSHLHASKEIEKTPHIASVVVEREKVCLLKPVFKSFVFFGENYHSIRRKNFIEFIAHKMENNDIAVAIDLTTSASFQYRVFKEFTPKYVVFFNYGVIQCDFVPMFNFAVNNVKVLGVFDQTLAQIQYDEKDLYNKTRKLYE